jgi:hypothetical protein
VVEHSYALVPGTGVGLLSRAVKEALRGNSAVSRRAVEGSWGGRRSWRHIQRGTAATGEPKEAAESGNLFITGAEVESNEAAGPATRDWSEAAGLASGD